MTHNMKRFALIISIALLAVSCKKVTPEERIEQFYTSESQKTSLAATISGLESKFQDPVPGSENNGNLVNSYILYLVKEAGLDLDDITTQDVSVADSLPVSMNVTVENKGKEQGSEVIVLSAPVCDVPASMAAIEIMRLYKEQKIKARRAMRLVLYQSYPEDETAGLSVFKQKMSAKNETAYLNMNLSCNDTLAYDTFKIGEPSFIFDNIRSAVPQFLEKYGRYDMVKTSELNQEWPFKRSLYEYNLNRNEILTDIPAVAGMLYLLN